MTIFRRPTAANLLAPALFLALLAGCAGTQPTTITRRDGSPRASTAEAATSASTLDPVIFLDGDTRDWPANTVATADEHHFYLRFTIEHERTTLQASPFTTSIFLDMDADASTGRKIALDGVSQGIDLEVQLSPRKDNAVSRGATLIAYDAKGAPTTLDPYAWDFAFTPTYASDWYEARLSRTPAGPTPCTHAGLLSQGTIAGFVATLNDQGDIDAYSEPFRTAAATQCMDGPRRSSLELPEKQEDALRIVSYNVLRSSPVTKPEVFQRVLGAIDPDVILFQEWELANVDDLRQWLDSMLPCDEGWTIAARPGTVQNGQGTAVASKYPVELLPAITLGPTTPSPGKAVRCTLARIDAPQGSVLAASVHLKSGGSSASKEDTLREHEARAINAALRAASAATPKAWRIVAGDMNLVGSRSPLDALLAQADTDATDLTPARTQVLGDRACLTWSEAGNAFAPGRLDWLLYSDAVCKPQTAFVLDTSRLKDDVLSAAGLTQRDSADASDHMPLVVDLVSVK